METRDESQAGWMSRHRLTDSKPWSFIHEKIVETWTPRRNHKPVGHGITYSHAKRTTFHLNKVSSCARPRDRSKLSSTQKPSSTSYEHPNRCPRRRHTPSYTPIPGARLDRPPYRIEPVQLGAPDDAVDHPPDPRHVARRASGDPNPPPSESSQYPGRNPDEDTSHQAQDDAENYRRWNQS